MASVEENENELTVATPPGEPGNYERTSGTAPERGKKFEIKMTALMFLRAKQITDGFWLGVDDSSAGLYDDVVLKYKKEDNEHALSIQLKYFNKALNISKRTKKFNLLDYYKSFEQLSERNISQDFKNTYFAFYTNTTLNLGTLSQVDIHDPIVRNLLSTGGSIFQIKFDEEASTCLGKKPGPNAKEFFERLIICSDQATLDVLDEIIKQEFMNLFSGIPPEYDNFLVEIEKYCELQNTTPYLTEVWEKWNKLWKTFENVPFSKIVFCGDVLHKVASEILDSEHKIIHVKCEGTDTHLSRLKIYQASRKLKHCKIMFVDLSETKSNLPEVEKLWVRGCYDVLVVDLATNAKLSWLEDVVQKNENSKRIVILSSDISGTSLQVNTVPEDVSFMQLEKTSQDYVLEKEVDFQGTVIKFGSLNAHNILTGVLLNTLLMNSQLQIGQPLPVIDQIYIRRKLSKRILVNKAILARDTPTEIFYISGATEEELQILIAEAKGWSKLEKKWYKANSHRFNVVEERMLHKVARDEKFVGKSVHFLEIVSDSIYWIHSVGNTRKVFEFIDTQPQESIDILIKLCETYSVVEDDLVVSGLTRLIITGEPGIGKTFLLSHMSERLKGIYPSHWIIFVNLNAYSTDLSMIKIDELTFSDVFKILASSAGVNSRLAEELLKTALNEVGNVCILCDAFDEIGPKHTEKVIRILKIICSKKIHMLWVSSRLVAVKKLESELQANVFTVQPFTEEEELYFFSKHWGEKRAKRMLELLYKKFTFDQGFPVSSFPLHMMMIHEVYNELVLSDNFMEISKSLNMTNMYEQFITKKFEIHYEEKNEMKEEKAGLDEARDLIKGKFMKCHMICSLAVLNIIEQLEDNKQKDKLMDKLEEYKETMTAGRQNTGIIDGFVNNNPRFIHRTFAEFFAAQWLAKNKLTSSSFIRKSMFEPWYKVVYEVFNRILAKNCPIHIAVLNKNVQECRELLKGDVNRKVVGEDAGGRTALHLAALHQDKQGLKLVKCLLDGGADMEVCDKLMKYTPLYYAVGAKAWDTVRILLEHGAHVNDSIAEITEVKNFITSLLPAHKHYSTYLKSGFEMNWAVFHNNSTIFHLAVEKGNIPCTKVLLEKGMDINVRNNNEESPLFRAIVTRQIEMIKFLMGQGADGADSSSVNKHGDSALRADSSSVNKHGDSALRANSSSVNKHGGSALRANSSSVNKHGDSALRANSSSVNKHGGSALRANSSSVNKHGDSALRANSSSVNKHGGSALRANSSSVNKHGGSALRADSSSVNKHGGSALRADSSSVNKQGGSALRTDSSSVNKHGGSALRANSSSVNKHGGSALRADSSSVNKHGGSALRADSSSVKKHGGSALRADSSSVNKHGDSALRANSSSVNKHGGSALRADSSSVKKHGGSALRANSSSVNKHGGSALRADSSSVNKHGGSALRADSSSVKKHGGSALRANSSSVNKHGGSALRADSSSVNKHGGSALRADSSSVNKHGGSALRANSSSVNKHGGSALRANSSSVNKHVGSALRADSSSVNNHGGSALRANSSSVNKHGDSALRADSSSVNKHGGSALRANSSSVNKHGGSALRADSSSVNKHGGSALRADSSSVNKHGDSALHVAAKYKDKKTLECLLQCGAVTDIKNKGGDSLLHLETILKSPETVDILLNQGVDVTDTNRDGTTPLHVCSQRGMLRSVAEKLLAHGASPMAVDRQGNTPLHIAVIAGVKEMIELLLDHDKSSLSRANMSGNTPLHLAVTEDDNNRECIVECLLKNGAPTSAVNKSGNTPLHIACACGVLDYVKLLLKYGAKPTVSNKRGDTPLHAVVRNGMSEKDSLFLDLENADAIAHNSTKRDVLNYISEQISNIVSVLWEHGASLEEMNNNGSTPLHVAVKHGIWPTVRLLLGLGAPAVLKDNQGHRPLDIAVTEGLLDKVEVLLTHEFQVSLRHRESDTPLP